jgi:cytidyltransferase-like protein
MESHPSHKSEKPVTVVASGYFSPLHSAHIEYLELAKELGDYLIVVVNNDKQEKLKKGKVFIDCHERMKIIKSLRCVDMVVESVDKDRSICKTLAILKPDIFANGGDTFNDTIPEKITCDKLGIKLVDGLGDKKISSSDIIKRAKEIDDYKTLKDIKEHKHEDRKLDERRIEEHKPDISKDRRSKRKK